MSKVWLVTGSARGLGRAIVEAALQAGERVVATARDPGRLQDLVARYGEQVRAIALDVTDPAAAHAAVQSAVDTYGRLDVVVNNAGFGHLVPFEQTSEDDFRAQIDTNFYGVVNVTRAALPVLTAARGAHHPDFVGRRTCRDRGAGGVSGGEVGGRRVHRSAEPGARAVRRPRHRARAGWHENGVGQRSVRRDARLAAGL